MPATIYYDSDADLKALDGKTIAIIGYGSQGHAQAQNLRDSGLKVVVAQRPGGPNYDLAKKHGFEPMSVEDAVKQADLINILLPDELAADVYKASIKPNLKKGAVLMASHGFNFHFGQIEPPVGHDVMLVAPKGPGHLVRSEYVKGGGVPCLIALGAGASPETKKLGLAYAKGIGGTRGGVSELIKAGFDTLVDAGYQPEMAYFECLHEMKLIVDLLYQGGLEYMRYSISNTAEYGDYTRGKRIITDETRAEMKKILEEIRSGEFARDWILENRGGAAMFKSTRRREREHKLTETGRGLRKMMKWIDSKEV